MLFLDPVPNVTPITNPILTWTHIGQALVASIGALAFVFALIRNNTVSSADPAAPAYGGGLFNAGATVSLTGDAIQSNTATNTGGGMADGGGIFNFSGTVTKTGTTVHSNIPDNVS
jgi:hypothetical protein